jgi:hypothetical protein
MRVTAGRALLFAKKSPLMNSGKRIAKIAEIAKKSKLKK